MNEISFEEILMHYQLKLKENIEDAEELLKCMSVSEQSRAEWVGLTSSRISEKMELIMKDTGLIVEELQKALNDIKVTETEAVSAE